MRRRPTRPSSVLTAVFLIYVVTTPPIIRGAELTDIPVYTPSVAASERPSGEVSLTEAVAAALLFNPALASYAYEVRAREARALQAGLLPNPDVSGEGENFGQFGGSGDDVEPAQTTISVAQLVELGGKRSKREEIGRLEAALASWDYEVARRDVANGTFKAFVVALVAQERMELAQRLVEVARTSVTVVTRQIEAGGASPVERTRADVALAQAEALAAQRERALRAARVLLAANWGATTSAVTHLSGQLETRGVPLSRAVLESGLSKNPDIARWDTEIDRAQADVALERAERIPDVTVRVGGRRFISAETNAFIAELSVPFPVFDRNQGGIQEALERLGKSRVERDAITLSAEASFNASYEELLAAFEQSRDLRARVIPRAEKALDDVRDAYAQGALRHLDILDAQRTLAELRAEYLEALAAYHLAAADLERLTGISPITDDAEGSTR
jgi:cobalt-zinc-cadmium efflux system outer membrane protein